MSSTYETPTLHAVGPMHAVVFGAKDQIPVDMEDGQPEPTCFDCE